MASELKHTVKPSGGDFDNLAAATAHIVNSHANLVTADVYAIIEIDGTWSSADTSTPRTAGIVTDATRYLKIYTTAEARFAPHGGWDTGAYILSDVSGDNMFGLQTDYIWLDGFQFNFGGSSGIYGLYTDTALTNGANQILVSNSVFDGTDNSSSSARPIYNLAAATYARMYFYNLIVIGNAAHPRLIWQDTSGGMYLQSCTIIANGGAQALTRDAGTCVAKNCYVGGSATADYNGTITKTTCASSDASGSVGLTGILVSETADATHAGFVDIGAGTEDFHLQAGSPLIGSGTDTSGDAAPMNFTTDIDGDSRS